MSESNISTVEIRYKEFLKNTLRSLPIMMFVGFVISLAMFFIADLPKIKFAANTKHWPTVEATVTTSSLSLYTLPNDKVLKDLPKDLYGAHIEYDYALNGVSYHSSRISASGWGDDKLPNSKEEYQSIVDKFPKGAKVQAYYDPANPSYALLIPGADLRAHLIKWPGICALLLTLGLMLYLFCLVLSRLTYKSVSNIAITLAISLILFVGLFVLFGLYLTVGIYIGEIELIRSLVNHDWFA